MIQAFMMAGGNKKLSIEFVGGYAIGFAGTTADKIISLISLTGGVDTQPREGDIVLVANGSSYAWWLYPGYAYLPTGYTSLFSGSASGQDITPAQISYKIMGSIPDTSLTIPGGTGHTRSAGTCAVMVFRNVDIEYPFDTAIVTANTANSAIPNPPAITPYFNGAMIVAGGLGANAYTGGGYSSSDLSNFFTAYGSDDHDSHVGVGIHEWTGGVFDPSPFTFNTTDSENNSAIGFTLALKPQ